MSTLERNRPSHDSSRAGNRQPALPQTMGQAMPDQRRGRPDRSAASPVRCGPRDRAGERRRHPRRINCQQRRLRAIGRPPADHCVGRFYDVEHGNLTRNWEAPGSRTSRQIADSRRGRDRALVGDRVLAHAAKNCAQLVRRRRQLQVGEQTTVIADRPECLPMTIRLRAAEQHRIERLVGALVLQQAIDMDARIRG